MSRMAEELARCRPDWLTIPDELERGWSWMEERGYGVATRAGYLLNPYADYLGAAPAFLAGMSLDGWFEEGAPGHSRLLPIAEAAGDGSIIALWRDDENQVRVVALGSEGHGYVIAESARGLLLLLAVGYDEINDVSLGEPPSDPVPEDALAPLRVWVESELDTRVPREWPGVGDDEFSAWLDLHLGREWPVAAVPQDRGTRVAGEVTTLLGFLEEPDGADVVGRVQDLTGARLKDRLRSSGGALRSVGLEVESNRLGVSTIWIRLADRPVGPIVKTRASAYPRPAALIEGLDESSTLEDALTLLGEPERQGATYLRYLVNGRYLHLEFDEGLLTLVTLMLEAP